MKLNYSRQVTCIGSIRLVFGKALIFTARKQSLGQGNIFTPVCHSVHRGGVCLSACWDTTPPLPPGTRHLPWSRPNPPGPSTPSSRPPWDQAPPRSRPPPRAEHAGRYGQRVGGTHPTGMQSGLFCEGERGQTCETWNCQSRVAQAKFPVDEG